MDFDKIEKAFKEAALTLSSALASSVSVSMELRDEPTRPGVSSTALLPGQSIVFHMEAFEAELTPLELKTEDLQGEDAPENETQLAHLAAHLMITTFFSNMIAGELNEID